MQEAVQEDPFAYANYNDFFTRVLKPELRPVATGANAIVSPADGLLAQFGAINTNKILQAKGHYFTLQDLLAHDLCAREFANGRFATVYLAPKDYHRVHMPLTGKLRKMYYVPGKLFSVNTHAAENIPNVFARNERVVSIFDTQAGPMAVVLVGAMIVGSIETIWAGQISPPHCGHIKVTDYTNEPEIKIAKGAEMGKFKLGSTVVVLFAADAAVWDDGLCPDMDLKMGQQIGLVK